jgi:hypothetical protein
VIDRLEQIGIVLRLELCEADSLDGLRLHMFACRLAAGAEKCARTMLSAARQACWVRTPGESVVFP